jgi:aspartate beta-hydroxylase
LQVAEEKLTWVENKAIVFDGSFKHEAWNFSDQLRVILIAYLWHPSLNEAERFFIDSIDERVFK